MTARAVILGCQGTTLSMEERAFFRDAEPWGFILFQRNCESAGQIRALVDSLRATVGRGNAPILIDQEGGRVQRLKPPQWRAAPAMARFGMLYRQNAARARESLAINCRLIAAELSALGITVDCLPVLDVPVDGAHDVIGDRAFARDPDLVAELGLVASHALLAGGVLPIVKHIPGHGRAIADSHLSLPRVTTPRAALEAHDFAPFRALRHMPIAMTGHVVYEAIDPDHPATTSQIVVRSVIREFIGFDGLLLTDDLSMKALDGSMAERARASLAAGCDMLLHCNGDRREMEDVVGAAPPLAGAAAARAAAALGLLRPPEPFDVAAALNRLDNLMVA